MTLLCSDRKNSAVLFLVKCIQLVPSCIYPLQQVSSVANVLKQIFVLSWTLFLNDFILKFTSILSTWTLSEHLTKLLDKWENFDLSDALIQLFSLLSEWNTGGGCITPHFS